MTVRFLDRWSRETAKFSDCRDHDKSSHFGAGCVTGREMALRRQNIFDARWLGLLCSCLLVLTGRSAFGQDGGEMRRIADIFAPLSRPSEMILEPTVLVLLTSLGIFLVVFFLLAYVVWKFRRKGPDDDIHEPPQIYGSNNIELAWTVIPCLIVFVLVLVTARSIVEIQNAPMPDDAVKVRLVGHQWWWEIHYPDLGIVTANEIHVPVSKRDGKRRPTAITLESADVIHSFWVPQLAGKTDLIPNRANRTWIEPFQTGTFFGNCAEYCGTQHANMLLRVIVQEPEEFDRWVASQKQKPAAPASALAIQGKADFDAISCINCHSVDGTVADGVFGPDLSKLMVRQTIGAGVAPLNSETLRAWLVDPQAMKPGCNMPDMKLTKPQLDSIVAYLETLK
jgi:cytochrome c oxidase subunit 2